MAGFSNKIQVILDVTADKAVTSMRNFRSSVRDADGAVDKFKAGSSAAMRTVQANSAAFGIAAATAFAGFAAKSVAAFTQTSKAAIDLGAATGLSTEQSSRWIAVADDMEVSASALTTGIGRIGKTLDSEKWKKYGVSTRDATGAARDANDILLDTFAMLGKVTNETERARIGNDLFGKGYASLAPMIGKTRSEYEGMLKAVEKGQVITAAEAAKAEKARLAWDGFTDAVGEMGLALGQTMSELAPVVEGLTKVVELAGSLTEGGGFFDFFGSGASQDIEDLKALEDELDAIGLSYVDFRGNLEGAKAALAAHPPVLTAAQRAVDEYNEALIATDVAASKAAEDVDVLADAERAGADAAEKAARFISDRAADREAENDIIAEAIKNNLGLGTAEEQEAEAAEEAADAAKANADAHEKVADAIEDRIKLTNDLYDAELSALDTQYAFEQSQRDLADAMVEYNESLKDGKLTSMEHAQATEDVAQNARDAAAAFAKQQGAADNSQASIDLQVSSLQGLADTLAPSSPLRARLLTYIEDLKKVPGSVNTVVNLTAGSTVIGGALKGLINPFKGGGDDENATGTDRWTGGLTWVGEKGKELVILPEGSGIVPTELTREAASHATGVGGRPQNVTHTSTPAPVASGAPAGPVVDPQDAIDAEDALQAAMYETGETSLATYRTYLQARQSSMVKWSAEWMAAHRDIKKLNEEEAADLKRLADEKAKLDKDAADAAKKAADDAADAKKAADEAAADAAKKAEEEAAAAIALADKVQKRLFESGQISLADYMAYLNGRQAGLDVYSDESMAIWDEMIALTKQAQDDQRQAEKDAEDARLDQLDKDRDAEKQALEDHLKAIEKLYDESRNRKDYADAAADADKAMAELGAAGEKAHLYGLDKKRTQEEKDAATADFEAAKLKAAQALYMRADAAANAAGIADGTEGWAKAVRASLEADKANAPGLAWAIDSILSGIPSFAQGGIMPGPRGKHSLAMVAGGEQILTEAQQAGAGPSYVINITGAIDAPRVAQQLRKILNDDARRNGRPTL